ncbi:MAG: cytochrome c peroxidase [Steroidobacteraceae bacterium]
MRRARSSGPGACAWLLIGGAAWTRAAQPPAAPYVWHLPRGFPVPAVPADNPMSDAKVALGERLFFEPRLSVTGRYSCSSCHDPARAFAQARAVAVGATGEALAHNALALVNVAYNISFGWAQPQVRSLEAQMLAPLLNEHPVELGLKGHEASVCAQLAANPAYAAAFAASFAQSAAPVSFGHVVQAIAAFERTLISGSSPFDRYVFGGEHGALSAQAKRGMALFFSSRVGCSGCHSGFNFAGNWRDAQGETGRAAFANDGTRDEPLRVPTLRNVALTAPYMHDGRFATLGAVLGHYSGLARRSPGGAPRDPRLPHAPLTAQDRAALSAFLESLTDPEFVSRFAGAAHSP